MPLLYCRFHGDRSLLSTLRRLVSCAVAAAVSASPSSTSLRRHFSLLLRHTQLWSTCLFLDFSRSPEDAMRRHQGLRRGQTHPKTANRFRVRSNIACVMQVDARPAMSTQPRKNPGHFYLQIQWPGRTESVVFASAVASLVHLEGRPLTSRFPRMGLQ